MKVAYRLASISGFRDCQMRWWDIGGSAVLVIFYTPHEFVFMVC